MLNINNSFSNSQINIQNIKQNRAQNPTSVPNFKGHIGGEFCIKDGKLKTLIQETAFFRQFITLEYVKDFVEKNFKPNETVKILDGACSTGEETWSLAMLFDKSNKNIELTGFDLGKDAISKARRGVYSISKAAPGTRNARVDGFRDYFLAFPSDNKLSKKQEECKVMFDSYFKENKKNYFEYLNKLFGKHKAFASDLETKQYRVRPEKLKKCNFVQGDILKLDELAEDKSINVFLFRNALYHLITTGIGTGHRVPMPESESRPILEKVIGGIRKKLSKNGLFVIGMSESGQTLNKNLTRRVLYEKGFRPLDKFDACGSCVWQKR